MEELKINKKKNKIGIGEGLGTEIQETQDQYRVVISKEANSCIEDIVNALNKDFEGGSISRSAVANYVFLNLSKLLSESDKKILKAQYFDPKKVLSAMLKSVDDLPEEIQKVLRASCGVLDVTKKRAVKIELSTDDSVDNSRR